MPTLDRHAPTADHHAHTKAHPTRSPSAPSQSGGMDVFRILLSIIVPPVGVFLQVGIGLHFWINLLLTLLGYVPGIIHAVWIIVKR